MGYRTSKNGRVSNGIPSWVAQATWYHIMSHKTTSIKASHSENKNHTDANVSRGRQNAIQHFLKGNIKQYKATLLVLHQKWICKKLFCSQFMVCFIKNWQMKVIQTGKHNGTFLKGNIKQSSITGLTIRNGINKSFFSQFTVFYSKLTNETNTGRQYNTT